MIDYPMKFLIGLGIILFALLVSVYVFIPGTLKVSEVTIIDCTISGANRYLLDQSMWTKWWPDTNVKTDVKHSAGSFYYNGMTCNISKVLHNRIEVPVQFKKITLNSTINILPLSQDTVAVQWQFAVKSSLNPVRRCLQYYDAYAVKRNMSDILSGMQLFLHNKQNVYGVNIQRMMNEEKSLMVTETSFTDYPSTIEIYNLISKLRIGLISQGGKEIDYPMVNVTKADSNLYNVMVAVPTDKKLQRKGNIYYKHTYPGRILVTEITGGPATIKEALKQMHIYIQDYQLVSPAIPYESLITDRISEPDTSKWVSKIYYPIF